ncbi:MFS transporter [Bdellovibrio reynosensis]|uniref:MFS transporter n=1 Tax=Bdellovibrio reynosensis TaxID=2835041 RepID=A0ABY4C5D8_9BACT|nr:MFS transporter [Bdellovibrio reynosensis]UOE99948.1 MFS transporter [Bdellovibrio reynosensis]
MKKTKSALSLAYFLIFGIAFADMIISPILIIHIRNGLGIDNNGIAWLMSIGCILIALLDYPTSHFADHFNKLLVLAIGTCCLAFSMVGLWLLPSKHFLIASLGLKAFGLASLSGTISAFVFDSIQGDSDKDQLIKRFITRGQLVRQSGIVLAMIIASSLIYFNQSHHIFLISALVYISCAILSTKRLLVSDIKWRSSKKIIEVVNPLPLLSYLVEASKNGAFRWALFLNLLSGVGFTIYITYWQLSAEAGGLKWALGLLTSLGFAASFVVSYILDRISTDKAQLFLGVGIVLFAFGTFCMSIWSFSFIFAVCGFQISLVAGSAIVMGESYRACTDESNSAKFFSLTSTGSEMFSSFILALFSSVALFNDSPTSAFATLLLPFAVILVLAVKRSKEIS